MDSRPEPVVPRGFRLHPWVREAAISFPRRCPSIAALLGVYAIQAVLLILAAWAALHEAGVTPGHLASAIFEYIDDARVTDAVAAFALAYFVTRPQLDGMRRHFHEGWWAAMPVKPSSMALTLLLAALACTAIMGVSWAIIGLLASSLRSGIHVRGALTTIELSSVLGALCAFLRACSMSHPQPASAVRQYLVRPRVDILRLDRFRFGQLAQWQRRNAALLWRGGRHFWMFGVVLSALPAGSSAIPAAGFLILASAAIWFSVALRSSTDVAASALRLLRTTPAEDAGLSRALLIYPTAAATFALLVSAAGSWLLGAFWIGMLCSLVILVTLMLPLVIASLMKLRRRSLR